MSRSLRTIEIGYYHVINRGVEKRKVFLDSADHHKFMSLIEEFKLDHNFVIHAFCLMANHYHLLIEVKQKNLSTIMHKINSRYSNYFNKKYNRVGHLWQGRFKSWYVKDQRYLTNLTKYIEQNPIRAGITTKIGDFPWSSSTTSSMNLTVDEALELECFHE